MILDCPTYTLYEGDSYELHHKDSLAMPLGYLSLVLHAHLPFVRHPEYEDFLEEDWLYEAITEAARIGQGTGAAQLGMGSSPIEQLPVPELPSAREVGENALFCAACGSPVAADSAFCGSCGTKVIR